jgi:hypothetical protein
MNFQNVIREQKEKLGAEKLHVTLGKNATPEGLRAEFEKINSKMALFNSFSELEQEKAKNARLRKLINQICKLSKGPLDEEENVRKFKNEIFKLTDLVPDVSLEEDIEWMEQNRMQFK